MGYFKTPNVHTHICTHIESHAEITEEHNRQDNRGQVARAPRGSDILIAPRPLIQSLLLAWSPGVLSRTQYPLLNHWSLSSHTRPCSTAPSGESRLEEEEEAAVVVVEPLPPHTLSKRALLPCNCGSQTQLGKYGGRCLPLSLPPTLPPPSRSESQGLSGGQERNPPSGETWW